MTVEKEGFAIVSTFRHLEYLLWVGVLIFTDHRNLAYIFEPEAFVSSVPKIAAKRLENWKMVLAQYDCMIIQISSEGNCWGDLLSRWVNVPAVAVRAVTVFASSAPDETMPSKEAIHEVQQQTRPGFGAMVSGTSSFSVGLDGRYMLWISEQANEMQTRLMVCVHTKDAGHRGVVATLQRLEGL